MTKMPVGILGGTFDPVHHGHLRLALETVDIAGLDHVRLVPLYSPSHRNPPAAGPEQRRQMLQLAIDNIESLVLEDCELQREGVSYTIDTLREIKTRLPDSNLCLIMGMDAFVSLDKWHDWRSIPETAHIIVVDRPEEEAPTADPEITALLAKSSTDTSILQDSEAGGVVRVKIPLLDISATRLRRMIAQGRDVRFLLPPSVLEFIQREQLYLSKHDQ